MKATGSHYDVGKIVKKATNELLVCQISRLQNDDTQTDRQTGPSTLSATDLQMAN